MPPPTSAEAPMFNGETLELLEFFDLFEDLADACSLTDTEKCKVVVRYVDKVTKRFWVTLIGYKSHDYDVFKKGVLAHYPGAEKGTKYTRRDLERVVAAPTNDDISTETALLQYYRQFRPVAVWLIANEKISVYERDRYFWLGLPATVRRAIDWRLQLTKVDYSRDEPTDYEDVLQAGRFVLSDDAFDADLDDPIAARVEPLRDGHNVAATTNKRSRPRLRRINQVDSDDEDEGVTCDPSARSRSQLDEVEDLARRMHALDITDVEYSVLYTRLACLAPAAAQIWISPAARQLACMASSGSRSYLATMVHSSEILSRTAIGATRESATLTQRWTR